MNNVKPNCELLSLPLICTIFCLIYQGFSGHDCDVPEGGCQTTHQMTCPKYTYGENCTECIPMNDCRGHYTCNTETGAKICSERWTGENCSRKEALPFDLECPDGAVISGCQNGGTCFDRECCCPPNYGGGLCEINLALCADAPCRNGGTCIPGSTNFTCVCPEG